MDRFAKLLEKVTDNRINPGDETTEAKNPRNVLADAVNPLLEEYVNPVLPEKLRMAIPKMTVADEKDYFSNLPENMAGAAMGTIKTVGSPRFSKFGDVFKQPTKQELVEEAQRSAMSNKTLQADKVKELFDKKHGEELLKLRNDKTKLPYEVDSWKQRMINNIRRELGEDV